MVNRDLPANIDSYFLTCTRRTHILVDSRLQSFWCVEAQLFGWDAASSFMPAWWDWLEKLIWLDSRSTRWPTVENCSILRCPVTWHRPLSHESLLNQANGTGKLSQHWHHIRAGQCLVVDTITLENGLDVCCLHKQPVPTETEPRKWMIWTTLHTGRQSTHTRDITHSGF